MVGCKLHEEENSLVLMSNQHRHPLALGHCGKKADLREMKVHFLRMGNQGMGLARFYDRSKVGHADRIWL